MNITKCPVCSCVASEKIRRDLDPHPYFQCPMCSLVYQPIMCDKVFEADHEVRGDLMNDSDKRINDLLARSLINRFKEDDEMINSTPVGSKGLIRFHLDIGSKYPYLGHRIQINDPRFKSHGIDGITKSKHFGDELGVKMIQGDFEKLSIKKLQAVSHNSSVKYDLITLVHCFEHFYNPLEAMCKIRSLISENGVLFIRSPDFNQPGIERDFTPGHYTIHPMIWTERAFYELLQQLGNAFVVEESYPLFGQRDYVLRPITERPVIGAGYIVKNEERDLPESLSSITDVVEQVCIRDTGSTDKTKQKALHVAIGHFNLNYKEYLGASSKDKNGDWQLWDFGKARNEYVKWLESNVDWILWMDADDVVTPDCSREMRRIPYMPCDLAGFLIRTGANGHLHHRMWRSSLGIRYEGRCHEYPKWGAGLHVQEFYNLEIIHNGDEKAGEGSVDRNLRILENEFKEMGSQTSLRTLFYLGNSYRDKKYFQKAIEMYDLYLSHGGNFHDERMFALIYKARSLRFHGRNDECISVVNHAIIEDASLAELHMEAAYASFNLERWKDCSEWCKSALGLPFKQRLFTEQNKYTDQPLRFLYHSLMKSGNPDLAYRYGSQVLEHTNDPSWRDFIEKDRVTVNIIRPGAIGDVFLCGWMLKGLKQKHPGCRVVFYTKMKEAAHCLIDVDEVRDSDEWINRASGTDYTAIGYPINKGYPDEPMTEHLKDYFSWEAGVEAARPSLNVPVITIKRPYITLHIEAGWSPYKQWNVSKWARVVAYIRKNYPHEIFLLGSKNSPYVEGTTDLRGETTIAKCVGLICYARAHLGVDSFTNHVAGILKTPSVILFGSTSPVGSGYPTAANLWIRQECSPCYRENPKLSTQSKGICPNPPDQTYENPRHLCMSAISVDDVIKAVENLL